MCGGTCVQGACSGLSQGLGGERREGWRALGKWLSLQEENSRQRRYTCRAPWWVILAMSVITQNLLHLRSRNSRLSTILEGEAPFLSPAGFCLL